MGTKTTKKKKAVKKTKKVAAVKLPKQPEVYFRVDMECPHLDLASGQMTYTFAEFYPGRGGTTDEPMARSMMEYLKRIGNGGKFIELDGTKDGKVLETWGGVSRVTEAIEEEKRFA